MFAPYATRVEIESAHKLSLQLGPTLSRPCVHNLSNFTPFIQTKVEAPSRSRVPHAHVLFRFTCVRFPVTRRDEEATVLSRTVLREDVRRRGRVIATWCLRSGRVPFTSFPRAHTCGGRNGDVPWYVGDTACCLRSGRRACSPFILQRDLQL